MPRAVRWRSVGEKLRGIVALGAVAEDGDDFGGGGSRRELPSYESLLSLGRRKGYSVNKGNLPHMLIEAY